MVHGVVSTLVVAANSLVGCPFVGDDLGVAANHAENRTLERLGRHVGYNAGPHAAATLYKGNYRGLLGSASAWILATRRVVELARLPADVRATIYLTQNRLKV